MSNNELNAGECQPSHAEIRQYVRTAIESFLGDPPSSPYQRGFLAALLVIWDEALEERRDDKIERADKLL